MLEVKLTSKFKKRLQIIKKAPYGSKPKPEQVATQTYFKKDKKAMYSKSVYGFFNAQ